VAYAVNVADMTMPHNRFALQWLVGPIIPSRQVVSTGSDSNDRDAVVLECPDDQAEAICEVLRRGGYMVRCYTRGTKGGWKAWGRPTRPKKEEVV
jgi:hypothetical protein